MFLSAMKFMRGAQSWRSFALIAALALSLQACSGNDWMGGSEKDAPLPGERISILDYEEQLKPDVSLEEKDLSINPPIENKFWPGPFGYSTNLMRNLTYSGKLQKIWERPIGLTLQDGLPLLAKPIIVDEFVYALNINGVLSKFNLENGEPLWSVRVHPRSERQPLIGGGLSYAAGRLFLANGFNEVLAVDPNNGGLIWRYSTSAPVRAAPTILAGRVFVVTAESETLALRADNGTLLWRHEGLKEKVRVVGGSGAAANRSLVVVPYPSGELSAIRMENGRQLWTQKLSKGFGFQSSLAQLNDIQAAPVMDGGLIFAMNYSGALTAIVQRSGARIWQQRVGGIQTPWVSGDYIFVLSDDNIVYALEKLSGKVVWLRQLDRFEDPEDKDGAILWHGPVMAGSKLYLAGSHGRLAVMEPSNGEVEAQHEIGAPLIQAPVVANGTLLLLDEDGVLHGFR